MRHLTLADIADSRAYERDRDEFRREVIALKRPRRVGIGPFVTVVFENFTTMRFQVQEMARAERMTTDAQIQAELDIYNPLIPAPGEMSMTLFVELTTESDLREWLPKLVGIERALQLRLSDESLIQATVEESHAAQLTREAVTASVHYVRFVLSQTQQELFAAGPVAIALAHPAYAHEAWLGEGTTESLLADWGAS